MAELVYAQDLGSCGETHEGSSPSGRITELRIDRGGPKGANAVSALAVGIHRGWKIHHYVKEGLRASEGLPESR